MITLPQLHSSLPFAQELTDQNLTLLPMDGPLGALVSELTVPVSIAAGVSSNDENGVKAFIPRMIEQFHATTSNNYVSEVEEMDGSSLHDDRMEKFVALVTTGVLSTLTSARSVVIPAIKHLEDAVIEALKVQQSQSLADLVIEEVGLTRAFESEAVYAYFEQYASIRRVDTIQYSSNIFPVMNAEDIAKLINSGDEEINTDLTNAGMKQLGDRTVFEHIYSIFALDAGALNNQSSIMRKLGLCQQGNRYDVTPFAIAYYLARGLLSNIPDGTNANESTATAMLENLTKYLGSEVLVNLKAYRRQIESKELFPVGLPNVDVNTGRVNVANRIIVNKQVYADFLESGGTVEMIYGNLVRRRHDTARDIIDDGEHCLKDYERFVGLNASHVKGQLKAIHLDALSRAFVDLLATDDDYKAFTSATGVYQRFRKHLERLGHADIESMDKLYVFLRTALSESFYPENPEIGRLIADVDAYSEDNEPGVAAAYYVVDLITEWLADQVSIQKHG